MISHLARIAGLAPILLTLACSTTTGGGWKQALEQDTPGAYHRYLREHPDSPQADEARERLAFAMLRKRPTAEGYEKFREKYPNSGLLAEIEQAMEEPFFERARARGTADAYRWFLEEFPDGRYAARAAGNAEYLAERGFAGRPDELADFASRHAASDFAPEAARSGAALDARRQSEFRRIGLVVEIAPGTPGAERLRRSYVERSRREMKRRGSELEVLKSASDPRAARVGAIFFIRHREGLTKPDIGSGSAFAGVEATATITLARAGMPTPIWSEDFVHRAPTSERSEEESILFGVTSDRFWEGFYLPSVWWSTQHAVRKPFVMDHRPVAVEAIDHRVLVMFAEGDFLILDLSDPANPVTIGRYVHPRDHSTWNGLSVIDGRVALYGGDGLEVVNLSGASMQRSLVLDRTRIGTLVAVEKIGSEWLIAGSRGLMLLVPGGSEPRMLLERSILAADLRGDRIVFTDGESLFVATLTGLRQGRAEAQLRLRKDVAPKSLRVSGNLAVLLGETDVLVVDLSKPSDPKIVARVTAAEAGEIRDAMMARGRLFLLGSRGLLVMDRRGQRVEDTLDVAARGRFDAAGRHLMLIGDRELQVVDTTPFMATTSPAAGRH
ncbi:MAG: hypothetical protein ACE5FL_14615 [Myxococcota bacterium]